MEFKRFDILNVFKNEVKQADKMQFHLASKWFELENYNEPLGLKKGDKRYLAVTSDADKVYTTSVRFVNGIYYVYTNKYDKLHFINNVTVFINNYDAIIYDCQDDLLRVNLTNIIGVNSVPVKQSISVLTSNLTQFLGMLSNKNIVNHKSDGYEILNDILTCEIKCDTQTGGYYIADSKYLNMLMHVIAYNDKANQIERKKVKPKVYVTKVEQEYVYVDNEVKKILGSNVDFDIIAEDSIITSHVFIDKDNLLNDDTKSITKYIEELLGYES